MMKRMLILLLLSGLLQAQGSEIFEAIDSGDADQVALLLKSDVDLQDRHKGWTPMTYAATKGYTKMVRLFLDHGVDVNETGRKRWTALIAASRYGYEKMARLLLERGADVNAKVKGSDYTALLTAIAHGHDTISLMILEKDVEVNTINNTGWTPVMAASRRGQTEVVRLLLEKGADPNKGTKSDGRGGWEGRTALYESAARGYLDVVKLLVEHGGDLYRHPGGNSPYKAARKRKHEEVVAYIESVHEKTYGKKKYRLLK